MPFVDNDGNIVSVVIPMSIIKEDVPKIMKEYNIGMHGYNEDEKGQEYLPNIFEQVSNALYWIGSKLPTKTVSLNSIHSYSAKHMAEKWLQKVMKKHVYISNGALIIASIMRGFPVKEENDSSNAYIGISKKTLDYEYDGYFRPRDIL